MLFKMENNESEYVCAYFGHVGFKNCYPSIILLYL